VRERSNNNNNNNNNKNTKTLTDASKEVGLEVNTEKTEYMLLSRHQNAGQNHDIKTGNKCFQNVTQFRYLGTTITNQNVIQEEIKRRVMLATIQFATFFFPSAVEKT
jgi:peptide methionine sulfoxide reductase MsrB